jgi:predicted NBD/HSP70 family sugar kinase
VWWSRFAAITQGMRHGDARLGWSAVKRGPSAGRVIACCLAAAVSLAACGDAEEPPTRPSTAAATATATAKAKARANERAEAVVRGWADDLRRGDVDAASARFAVPAVVSNNSPEIKLSSRRDVRGFNASLPCGGRVTKILEHHGVLLATIVLTDRPGGDCGSGVGGVVQTAFEVRRGLIVRWVRVPDADAAPPPPGSSEA